MGNYAEIFQILLSQSDIFLLLAPVILFDLPRYFFSTMALVIGGMPHQTVHDIGSIRVSIVIPVSNGETSILETLKSIRASTVDVYEVIVVNDGSQDNTSHVLEAAKNAGLINMVITHKDRAGRSAACNHGARFASGDLVLFIDSDTKIHPDGVKQLASVFSDPDVGAASGNLTPFNKDESLLTSLQAIEYLVSIMNGRAFLDLFGANACCSGAFSMYRTSVFSRMGGFSAGSGEDLEMTLRLRRYGYKIRFAPAALAYTIVPSTLAQLVKQRLRWERDAVAIRLFNYRQHSFANSNETASDTLMRLDFVIFDFLPTLLFPGYAIYLISHFGSDSVAVFMSS